MADQDHRTAIGGQRLDQGLTAFDIKVVGWLVKDQQVWRIQRGQHQRQPRLLPARKAFDKGFGLVCPDAEASKPRAQFGGGLVRAKTADMVDGCFIKVQLFHLMLREITNAQFRGAVHASIHRLKFAR